jgi:polyisoprenoid-binding protein YceI
MNRSLSAVLLMAFWFLPTSPVLGSEWQIDDDHSNAYFSIQHLTVSKVRGSFNTVSGSATIDDKTGYLTGLNLTVDVNSIDTGVAKRDEDLRSPNFFEVAKYPTITFVSKGVDNIGNGILLLTGDLTIHGVTREVTVTAYGPTPEIKDPWSNARRGLRVGNRLNRQDYGMNYNKVMDTGGLLVGNMVDAEADLEIVKK